MGICGAGSRGSHISVGRPTQRGALCKFRRCDTFACASLGSTTDLPERAAEATRVRAIGLEDLAGNVLEGVLTV